MTRYCPWCGAELVKRPQERPAEFNRRRSCNRHHTYQAVLRDRNAVLVAEVEFLLAGNMHPLRIAERLGTTMRALNRRLYRNGHPELAAPFGRTYTDRNTPMLKPRIPPPPLTLVPQIHNPQQGDWTNAACKKADPDLFFSTSRRRIEKARTICRACPLAGACLEEALRTRQLDDESGVWGGTDPRQRRKLLRGVAA